MKIFDLLYITHSETKNLNCTLCESVQTNLKLGRGIEFILLMSKNSLGTQTRAMTRIKNHYEFKNYGVRNLRYLAGMTTKISPELRLLNELAIRISSRNLFNLCESDRNPYIYKFVQK